MNEKYSTCLDPNFSTSRDVTNMSDEYLSDSLEENYIFVGSSHANRTATAMNALGEPVNCLASPYWQLNGENVNATAKILADATSSNPGAVVIYQLYDSSIYFSLSEEGESTLPKRGEDGAYHVVGELILAD